MRSVSPDPEIDLSPPLRAFLLHRSSSFQRTFILFHYPVQRITHIRPHIVVPVLIHRQRAARVLEEQVQQPALDA